MLSDLSNRLRKIAVAFQPPIQRLAHVLRIIFGSALPENERKEISKKINQRLLRAQQKRLGKKALEALKGQIATIDYDLAIETLLKRYSVPDDRRMEYRQQIYLKVWSYEPLYTRFNPVKEDGSPQSFLSWFMDFCTARLINMLKRKNWEGKHFEDDPEEQSPVYEEKGFGDVEKHKLLTKIREVLNSKETLREQQVPEVFDLLMQHFSQKEIAEKLNTNTTSINRKMTLLKDTIKNSFDPEELRQLMQS